MGEYRSPSGAVRPGRGRLESLAKKRETGELKKPRVVVSQRLPGGSSHRRFFTIRLQPQMKKYRCLWYKSTTNHNILYFVAVSGIWFQNANKRLWKAQNGLAQRGLAGGNFAPNSVQPGPARRLRPRPQAYPSPGSGTRRRNGAFCRSGCVSCGDSGRFLFRSA